MHHVQHRAGAVGQPASPHPSAPGARRTANRAYNIATLYKIDPVAFPIERRPALFPDRAPGAPRGANAIYWLPSKFLTQFPRSFDPLVVAKGRTTRLHATEREFNIPAKGRTFVPKPKRP